MAPMARSDHQAALETAGCPAVLHDDAIVAAQGAGLMYQPSRTLGEDVLYSPYVWSTQALDVAEFFNRLPANERELLMGVSQQALQRPGLSEDTLNVSDNLLRGARRVGLIDATRVQTATNEERSFVFSPTLERQLASGSTEVTHQCKLFTAHILYGHRYGQLLHWAHREPARPRRGADPQRHGSPLDSRADRLPPARSRWHRPR